MLTLLAHQGETGPHHDLWTHWNAHPAVLVSLALAAWAYQRGTRRRRLPHRARDRSFWVGLCAVGVALVSPIDAVAADLASAHMVQHVLLVAVAAPLLAYSTPAATMLRSAPGGARAELRRLRRAVRDTAVHSLQRPGAAWLLHAGVLWFWHASGPYGAAIDNEFVHATQHATFLLTAVLFWSAVVRRSSPAVASDGYRALLVFTMAMQGVFLSALLTFATRPWYEGYVDTAPAWGLEPLADQQLAGVIMWVPAGMVYVAVGVALVARWVRRTDGVTTGVDSDWVTDAPGQVSALRR